MRKKKTHKHHQQNSSKGSTAAQPLRVSNATTTADLQRNARCNAITSRQMPAFRSTQAAAKIEQKQRGSDDGDDGGDGYTKQNERTMRKRSEHSDDDADCDSNSAKGADVDDHSENGGEGQPGWCDNLMRSSK